MTHKKIYILGAGNMARETLGIYKDLGKFNDVNAFVEENCKQEGRKIDTKKVMDASIISKSSKKLLFIGAMGSPHRKRWIEEVEAKGFDFDIVIHPSVIMGEGISVAKGCIICPGVILTRDIKIGRHSIININSTINHTCLIGDFVTIAPGVNIAGDVRIGDGCWIGIGTTIIQKVSIGQGSLIGAGAVVTKDIPENTLAMGVPAKPIKKLNKSDWEKLIQKF